MLQWRVSTIYSLLGWYGEGIWGEVTVSGWWNCSFVLMDGGAWEYSSTCTKLVNGFVL